MTTETTKDELTARDYATALEIQDACNLSGVVFEFARVMQRLCNSTKQMGTDDRNTHPICVLFADKIMDLANRGQSFNVYCNAASAARAEIAKAAAAQAEYDEATKRG